MVWLTIWSYVKKYWQYALLAVGAIIGIVMFTRQDSSFSEQLKAIQDAHDAELKQINDARAEEERKSAENEKQLRDTLAAIQVQYDAAEKTLDDKKKSEIEQIVKKYGNDPDELAKQLSASTGFIVITPSN